MHENNRSGELRGTKEQLSRLARCSTVEFVEAVTELQTSLAADVVFRNDVYTIQNRRMKREFSMREKRSQAGSKSNANRLQKPDTDNDNESLEKVREFARGEGIRMSDAEWFWHKCQGNGWTNGGRPIKDWKATLRSWQRAGYLPSQKREQRQ
jgi:hypothetical protein